MQTQELEAALRALDRTVLQLGGEIQGMRKTASGYLGGADACEREADRLLAEASAEEDPEASMEKYSLAAARRSDAENLRVRSELLQSEIAAKASELRGYRAEYQSYMAEGQENLAELAAAAQKLTGVLGSRYGGAKLSEALAAVRQRIVYNQNLVKGCQKRIAWIDQICGPDDGTQMVKVKKLR